MPEYNEWLRQIDGILEELCGCNTGDLEYDYEGLYDEVYTPQEVAVIVMREWGFV